MKQDEVKLHYEKIGDTCTVRAEGSFVRIMAGLCDLAEKILRKTTDSREERLAWLEHIYRILRGRLEEEEES